MYSKEYLKFSCLCRERRIRTSDTCAPIIRNDCCCCFHSCQETTFYTGMLTTTLSPVVTPFQCGRRNGTRFKVGVMRNCLCGQSDTLISSPQVRGITISPTCLPHCRWFLKGSTFSNKTTELTSFLLGKGYSNEYLCFRQGTLLLDSE